MIGPENLRHSLNQSDVKFETKLLAFCRLYFEFSLAPKGIFLRLISRCDYCGLGLTTLNRNAHGKRFNALVNWGGGVGGGRKVLMGNLFPYLCALVCVRHDDEEWKRVSL